MNKTEFFELVDNAIVNEKISFGSINRNYKSVYFNSGDYGNGIEYSWVVDRINFGWIFPEKSANTIKTFKTLNGAKRNFKKWCDFIQFEE